MGSASQKKKEGALSPILSPCLPTFVSVTPGLVTALHLTLKDALIHSSSTYFLVALTSQKGSTRIALVFDLKLAWATEYKHKRHKGQEEQGLLKLFLYFEQEKNG